MTAPARPAARRPELARCEASMAEHALSAHLRMHRTCGDNGPCKAYEEYESDLADAERALAATEGAR